MIKGKKGQLDMEVVTSPGFVILLALGWGATLTGYIMGKKMDFPTFPLWQLILIMAVEVVAAYLFAARG